MAFMDLEKACDRIDRNALWLVLRIYGVGGNWHCCKSVECLPLNITPTCSQNYSRKSLKVIFVERQIIGSNKKFSNSLK